MESAFQQCSLPSDLRGPALASRKLLKSPGRLKTLERREEGLAVLVHRRARTPWLTCVPLGVIAALPLAVEGPLTLWRCLTTLCLGSVVAFIVGWSRPRTMRKPLTIEGRRFRCGEVDIDARSLELGGAREDWSNSTPVYRLDALGHGGARATLLEGPDPAPVLAQARELSHACGLPLSGTWGNGMGQSPRPRASLPEVAVKGTLAVSQRSAGWTSLGSTIFVLLFFLMLVNTRLDRGLTSLPLSLILPLPAVFWGLGLSLWLLGVRAQVAFVPRVGLVCSRSLYGRPLGTETLREEELLHVEAVAPDGGEPLHLLVESTRGVRAWPLVGAPAIQVARAFSAGSSWVDQSPDLRQPVEKIAVPGHQHARDIG